MSEPLKLTTECIPCALNSLLSLFRQGVIPEDKQEATMRELLRFLSRVEYDQIPPALAQEMHRLIRRVSGNPDPYCELKAKSNALMLAQLPALRAQVAAAADTFQMALRLAIAGNVIDFGPTHAFDIAETVKRAGSVTLAIDHSAKLQAALRDARRLLYIGDNAGEIVLDRLFLETIRHPQVVFAVRGAPVINDATHADAVQAGIDAVAAILSNGDDAPGTLLDHVSPEFLKIFDEADLIIAKGQGNFESLSHCGKNICFLLMAKCDHVARRIGVRKGDFIVQHP